MKNFAIILIVALFAFAGGWLLNEKKYATTKEMVKPKNVDSTGKENTAIISIEQKQEDHSSVIADVHDTTNYASKISGRFILKDSKCAGFDFINKTSIAWANEIDCGHPDTFRLYWFNNKTFFTKDIEHIKEGCPPRIWVYQIISCDEKHLVLNEVGTGWGNFTNERLEFTKDENPE